MRIINFTVLFILFTTLGFANQNVDSLDFFQENVVGYIDKEGVFIRFTQETYEKYLVKVSPVIEEGEYYAFNHFFEEQESGVLVSLISKITIAKICGGVLITFKRESTERGERYVLIYD